MGKLVGIILGSTILIVGMIIVGSTIIQKKYLKNQGRFVTNRH
jgi:hypothetical protein